MYSYILIKCEKIKSDPLLKDVIVIFLSARNEEFTQVACYDAGAEDFVSKPIQPKLLIKKIEVILKRFHKEEDISLNGVRMDVEKYKVYVDDRAVHFSKKQFDILQLLYNKPDFVFSRDSIISKVWGKDYYVSSRNLDVQIRKIREKIGDKKIGTIKGVGYKFCAE